MPKSNNVSRVHNVAAILWSQYMISVMLFTITNVLYFTLVLSEVCVQCPIWLLSVAPWCCAFQVCYSGILLLLFSVSPLCRVSTLIFLRQTMSLGNIVLQLFWC